MGNKQEQVLLVAQGIDSDHVPTKQLDLNST